MRSVALAASLLLTAAAAQAAETDFAAVQARVAELVPQASDVAVAETPIPGVLEVRVNNEVVYMTRDARYLLQGRMVDLDTQTDLTDQARVELRKSTMANWDDSTRITFSPDAPDHEIYIFTDIDCGYCRRLHGQIEEYNELGIGVHYLMFPRGGVGTATWDKSVSVWCADDQHDAMTAAKSGDEPRRAVCDSPVEEHYRLGQAMGVTGTPAMVTMDGTLIPGYVPPAQLRERLDQLNGSR